MMRAQEADSLKWEVLRGAPPELIPPGRWVPTAEIEACGALDLERATLEERVEQLRGELARLEDARGTEIERLREEAHADAGRRLAQALDGLESALRRERVAMAARAREACMETVSVLIGAHCTEKPEALLAPVEALLEARSQVGALCLRVAPAQRPALERRFAHHGALRIAEDPELAPGDAVLEVPEGQYDCRVATLLAADAARTLPTDEAHGLFPEAP